MGLKVGVVAVVFCVFAPVSSPAQFIWDWDQQVYTTQRLTSPQPRRYHREQSSRRATRKERTRPQERANRDERTKRAKLRSTSTWRDMSQDRAREWLKEQVGSFCGKYPKDQSCYWPKKEDDQPQ